VAIVDCHQSLARIQCPNSLKSRHFSLIASRQCFEIVLVLSETVLDENGSILTNQETGSLEEEPKHDPKLCPLFFASGCPKESTLKSSELMPVPRQLRTKAIEFNATKVDNC